jgi:hypothetical protein
MGVPTAIKTKPIKLLSVLSCRVAIRRCSFKWPMQRSTRARNAYNSLSIEYCTMRLLLVGISGDAPRSRRFR